MLRGILLISYFIGGSDPTKFLVINKAIDYRLVGAHIAVGTFRAQSYIPERCLGRIKKEQTAS